MTTLEAIQKIKQMFVEVGELPSYVEEPVSPSAEPIEAAKEYTLKSGLKVMIDALAIGGKVAVVDEAGNAAPAPAGEHELIDGTKIVLDEASSIVQIELPQAEIVEELEEPMENDAMEIAEEVGKLEEKIEDLKEELEDLKVSYDAKLAKQAAKFSKGIADLSDVMVQLINTPSADATEAPKDKFNQHIEKKEDKMKRFLDFAKSIK
jgi:hypothetical protein